MNNGSVVVGDEVDDAGNCEGLAVSHDDARSGHDDGGVASFGQPSPVAMALPLPRFTAAESSLRMGVDVLLVSDFNSSAGHWISGETMPRMKSTSPGRKAAASASRSPAWAPGRMVGLMPSGTSR